MPGVLIVEFGTAAALTAHGLDKSTYENKLVFLMGVEKARFRNPVIPDCDLICTLKLLDHMDEFGSIKVKHLLMKKKWQMQFGLQLLLTRNN